MLINATKLCAIANKRFDNWLANKSSKELIKNFKELSNDKQDMDIVIINNGIDIIKEHMLINY